jgi:hypothetical protein
MTLIDRNLNAKDWSMEFVDRMLSNDEGVQKTAELSMQDYLRHSNYEQSFCNQIVSNTPFKKEDLVPQLDTDQSVIMIEIEPDSAGAVQVDLDGDMRPVFTPYGRRVQMTFQEVASQRVVKSQLELMGYRYNLRTVLTDLMSLRMATVKDLAMIRATEACLAPNGQTLTYTGKGNQKVFGNNEFFTWNRFQRSLNLMRQHANAIEPATWLFNHLALGLLNDQIRVDFGATQVAADMFSTTNSELKIPGFGGKIISTIKKNVVPNGRHYYYGPENQMARYTQVIDPTMSVDTKKMRISFQMYEVYGMLFINLAAVAAVSYDASNLVP